MTPRQKRIWDYVIARDKGKCVSCRRPACEVHHIIPRSNPGPWTWLVKNMACLCKRCHDRAQNGAMRRKLFKRLSVYGYDYSQDPFREYAT